MKARIEAMLEKLAAKIEHAAAQQEKPAAKVDGTWRIHNGYRNELEAIRDDLRHLLLDVE